MSGRPGPSRGRPATASRRTLLTNNRQSRMSYPLGCRFQRVSASFFCCVSRGVTSGGKGTGSARLQPSKLNSVANQGYRGIRENSPLFAIFISPGYSNFSPSIDASKIITEIIMLHCKVCDKPLSDQAKKCPGCGDSDPVYAKRLMLAKCFLSAAFWIAVVVSGALFILSVVGVHRLLPTVSRWTELTVIISMIILWFVNAACVGSWRASFIIKRLDLASDRDLSRGRHSYSIAEYDKAVAEYNRAIELDSKNDIAFINRGDAAPWQEDRRG
jgi:hypothetical protein